MKTVFVLLALFAANTFAAGVNSLSPYEVVAPSLTGDPSAGDRVAGQIYLDISSGLFKGIDNNGDVKAFGSLDRVERARVVGSTEYTNCTADPCVIITQSGSWLAGVAR